MAYDIFISYRRRDSNGVERGTFIASSIQQALHNRGYKERVFFDHEEIGPGKFEEIILNAIKQSKIFIFVLTKDSLLRCVDEDDWVRREICQAVESKLFIIFINPNGEFQENYPEGFPKELDVVKETNHIPIYVSSLNLHMDNLVEKYINPYIKKHNTQEDGAIVRIDTDLDCRVLLYGEQIGVAKVGEYTKMTLPLGDSILKFVGLENDADCDEQFITIENYHQKLIKVKLLDKYNTRRAKEKAEEQRLDAEQKAIEEAAQIAEQERIEAEKRAKAKAERAAYLLSLPDNEFERFEGNGKYGFKLKTTDEIVIPLKYDYADPFSEGLAWVRLNGKYGFIDKTGKEVTPLKYDLTLSFREGLAAVELNGKYGYIDKTGKEVIPLKYDGAWSFSEGLAWIKLNYKYGFIDKTGNKVIPLKYDWASASFSEGLAKVKLNGKYGYIDKTGKEVIPLKYDNAWNFSEGLTPVELHSKYGFIDKTGKEVTPLKYDLTLSFREGLAWVKLNGKYGYIDKTGKEVITLKYDGVGDFSEGLATVLLNRKWGYIDKTGNEITPLKYDLVSDSFCEGLAWVELNGKYGFIDKTGKEVIPLKYDGVWSFSNGKAKVMTKNIFGIEKKFYIDKNGNRIEE